MTAFGALYYTDCRPGQGLQPRTAGFQFQAASPGVAEEAMPLVARSALYEPPRSWMREQRAVGEYPASLAHVVDGGLFATAAGCYLGKEANGTREGNQFTHAIVTRDAADYGLVRPAQLWAAPWWVREPAPGTELDPLPAHPEPGVLDTETVRRRVGEGTDGAECLVALLSAIQRLADPTTRRTIVLVSADPEAAACWVAAATVLMPVRDALRTTFKIFVADASYSSHDIVGVHPEWAGRWGDTGPETGVAVFNLDRGTHTAIEPTEDAAFWVPRFLADDPFDVVDAVELAGQFAAAREQDGAATGADRLIALVMAAGEPLRGPEQVQAAADWLRTAPEPAVKLAREIVIDAVLAARPGAPVLRTLADAAGARGWSALATIHSGLLRAELDAVLAAGDGLAALDALERHPALVHLGTVAPDDDRDMVESALRAARPDMVPALLTLARRHRLAVRPEVFAAQAEAFAWWWIQNPAPALARWQAPQYALDWAVGMLRAGLTGGGDAAVVARDAVEQRWWQRLWKDARSLRDPLDWCLISTAYRRLDKREGAGLARHTVGIAAAEPPPGGPPDAVAWRVLFNDVAPTFDEARRFVDDAAAANLPMSPDIAKRLCIVLDQVPDGSAEALDLVRRITAAGHPLTERQHGRLASESAVRAIADALLAEIEPPADRPIADRLAKTPPALVELHAAVVVDAMVRTHAWQRAIDTVRACPRDVLRPIYDELQRRWPQTHGKTGGIGGIGGPVAEAMAFSFELVSAKPGGSDQEQDFKLLRTRLGQVVAVLSKEDRARIEQVNGLHRQEWREWVAEVEPGWLRKLPRLGRGSRRAAKG
jgi:GTPase-associated protein 1, N-terminal domain type 2/GTPase-associated protein 1, middle domain